jgi:hypothetical protein
MALVGLVMPSLVNGSPLRNAVVVTAPDNVGPFRKAEHALHSFAAWVSIRVSAAIFYDSPYFDVAAAVVLRPYAEDILATPHTEHNATNLLASFEKLVTYKAHEQLLPVAICHTLLETHDPLPTPLVLVVLPHRPYALLEDVVVGNGR